MMILSYSTGENHPSVTVLADNKRDKTLINADVLLMSVIVEKVHRRINLSLFFRTLPPQLEAAPFIFALI